MIYRFNMEYDLIILNISKLLSYQFTEVSCNFEHCKNKKTVNKSILNN